LTRLRHWYAPDHVVDNKIDDKPYASAHDETHQPSLTFDMGSQPYEQFADEITADCTKNASNHTADNPPKKRKPKKTQDALFWHFDARLCEHPDYGQDAGIDTTQPYTASASKSHAISGPDSW